MKNTLKKLLIITLLAFFALPCFAQMETLVLSDKSIIYTSQKSSLCFYDGSVGEIIFEISYDGSIYINPNIPVDVIAKRLFEILDEQFYWALDECQRENRELKEQISNLK